MIEVLWHGRGGQGAFTAARLLGAAASLSEGCFALAFPSFGPERRGAPMRAFTKLDNKPIGDRSAIAQADFVVYLDETLLDDSWGSELKSNGKILVNSARSYDDARIVAIDADGISSDMLGRPIPNTVFLGALAALSDRVGIGAVRDALRLYLPKKLHEGNLAIVDAVFSDLRNFAIGEAQTSLQETRKTVQAGEEVCAFGSQVLSNAQGQAAREELCSVGASGVSGTLRELHEIHEEEADDCVRSSLPLREDCRIPTLRVEELDPNSFAHSTCFEAGYLVGKNAGWRNVRPVVAAATCTGCLQCYLYCPDGAVVKHFERAGKQAVSIDYDFCKGCGICARVCKFGAIAMMPERDADKDEEAAR